jgi:serine/threonine-protein phosphatase 2B catalytic subunit
MTIPTDDQFFSKTEKGKPDVAFLKNHFYREGRLKEEHALFILEKATRVLRAEPNVLTVDSPVTGAQPHIRVHRHLILSLSPVCGDIHGQYVRIPPSMTDVLF